MPRPGGAAGKIGDLYEALWTTEIALDVIEGRLLSITVEAIGEDSLGVEFQVVTQSGDLQYHSVKRQKSGHSWSIADLCRIASSESGRSILGDLLAKRKKWPNCGICFVSSTGANELRELAERAKESESLARFISGLSKNLENGFQRRIVPLCDRNPEDAYLSLKSLQVRLRDHSGLAESLERRIDSLLYRIDGSPIRASDVRRMIAEHLSLNFGSTLNAELLRTFLRGVGIGLRDWKIDLTLSEKVFDATARYRSVTESELINGGHIRRNVAGEIVSSLLTEELQGVLLVAPGGYGKSCTLTQSLEQLQAAGFPILCIRMDSFSPCQTTAQVGHQMGLTDSPVRILAALADNAPCVLLIDQLDAMSLVSGRNPKMWEVFEHMTNEAKMYPNMKLLLACRDFDLQHDYRLRALGNVSSGFKRFTLSPLSVEEVHESLFNAGHEQLVLPAQSTEILRIPFHLQLFLQGESKSSFTRVSELYDRYWTRKRYKLREFLGRDAYWNEVVDALTTRMSNLQLLFSPISIVGNWSRDAQAMASENVLIEVKEQRHYRFFHESFFDYAFARRFCETNGDICSLLSSSEQHLFRRAQVRQILAYRRENDFDQYLRDVTWVLDSNLVRTHIKKLVAIGFRGIDTPTVEEWTLIEKYLSKPILSNWLLPAIRNHNGWFDLLNSLGVFQKWLAAGNWVDIDRAIWFLEAHGVHEKRSSQIAYLIAPYVSIGGEWTARILRVMSWGQSHLSEEMSNLYLELIERGVFDGINDNGVGESIWSQLFEAEKKSPKFIVDVLEKWFARAIRFSDDGSWNFVDRCHNNKSHEGAMLVCSAAARLPEYFLEKMLPLVVTVVKTSAVELAGEVHDRAWPWLSNNGEPYDLNDAILLSVRRSLQYLAKYSPETLRLHAKSIAKEPHRTFAYLLLRAWADNPTEFANECCEFLVEDRRRLNIGFSSWSGHDEGSGESAISRIALKSITEFCSQDLHLKLENVIIGYCDEYEKSTPKWRGSSELLRLRCLSKNRISQRTRLRIEELERKFPQLSDKIVPEDKCGLIKAVGSPLDFSICQRMTDPQWISAMRKYDKTTDSFKGGPFELSRMLAMCVQKSRVRFANLVQQMPDDVDSSYFSAIADGLCSRMLSLSQVEREADDAIIATVPTEIFLSVIERLHALPNQPCGSAILGCISKIANRPLPQQILEIASFYAIHDPDPISNEYGMDDRDVSDRLRMQGINCVRGQGAECIAALLFEDEDRIDSLKEALERCSEDQVLAVRNCAINALLPVLNFDRNYAVERFLVTCAKSAELCATREFDEFVHYSIQTHYTELQELLQFALRSDVQAATENAARQITLADLSTVDVGDDAQIVRDGTDVMRKAVADVYAHNISNDAVGDACARNLKLFLNDESKEVQQSVARAFYQIAGKRLLELEEFVLEYIESDAFITFPESLFHCLTESHAELPNVICRAAERILDDSEGGENANGRVRTSHLIATLVVRQYEQAKDAELKARCLNLVDRLETSDFYGIGEELAKIDR